MEKKVRKNKELTVGVALVSLFVGIAVFVPKVLNTEASDYPQEETRQEERLPMRRRICIEGTSAHPTA